MKAKQLSKFSTIGIIVFVAVNLVGIKQAFAQLDYYSGINKSGIRISAGVGGATLQTHFNQNPIKLVYIGNLDYDINPYLSFGLEGQYGTLQGIDNVHRLKYYSSTDKYFSGTANIRVALGEFDDFTSDNGFKDALKKIYLGIGAGAIKTDNVLIANTGTSTGIYGNPKLQGKYLLIAGNFGTNIDLPGVLGVDRLSINPNFQLNYVNSLYLDGFQSTQTSTLKGYYNIVSVKLKYKF